MEENYSASTKNRIIMVVVVIAVIILLIKIAPDYRPEPTDDNTTKVITQQTIKYVQVEREELEDDINEQYQEETNIEIKNSCNKYNFGHPDYSGTQNEGKDCSDFQNGNAECIMNPPGNYDGEIILSPLSSNPEITCCNQDGTCQW